MIIFVKRVYWITRNIPGTMKLNGVFAIFARYLYKQLNTKQPIKLQVRGAQQPYVHRHLQYQNPK